MRLGSVGRATVQVLDRALVFVTCLVFSLTRDLRTHRDAYGGGGGGLGGGGGGEKTQPPSALSSQFVDFSHFHASNTNDNDAFFFCFALVLTPGSHDGDLVLW